MTQGVLPFKYEEEKTQTGMTALAGLPVYLDLAKVIGLSKSIQKHLKVRENSQGWTDSQMVLPLVLLNLAGGDCVDDLKILEADEGFCQILRKSKMHGLSRKIRRALESRWRKENFIFMVGQGIPTVKIIQNRRVDGKKGEPHALADSQLKKKPPKKAVDGCPKNRRWIWVKHCIYPVVPCML